MTSKAIIQPRALARSGEGDEMPGRGCQLKALSIRPDWAHAIVHFGKRIENRTWNTHYRGPLLIHAGQKMTRAEYANVCALAQEFGFAVPAVEAIKSGGIVGIALLEDVVIRSDDAWFGGPYGFVLAKVRSKEFVPMKGQLGLFSVRLENGV